MTDAEVAAWLEKQPAVQRFRAVMTGELDQLQAALRDAGLDTNQVALGMAQALRGFARQVEREASNAGRWQFSDEWGER